MSGGIWMCSSPKDTRLILKVASAWFDDLSLEALLIQKIRDNDLGREMTRGDFPPSLHLQPSARARDKKPSDIFIANGFIVVSENARKVFSNFELGDVNFFAVKLYDKDKSTIIDPNLFFLNYGNAKPTFIPANSKGAEPVGATDMWHMPINPEDGDVAVASSALSGPDLWVDPACRKVFFVTEALGRAIRREKLSGFWFTKCHVV